MNIRVQQKEQTFFYILCSSLKISPWPYCLMASFSFFWKKIMPLNPPPWGKQLYFAIWSYSLNYLSNDVFFIIIMFTDHENLGIEPKIIVLLCTVQELWLFYYAQIGPQRAGNSSFPSFDPAAQTIYPIMFSLLYSCSNTMKTQVKSKKLWIYHVRFKSYGYFHYTCIGP